MPPEWPLTEPKTGTESPGWSEEDCIYKRELDRLFVQVMQNDVAAVTGYDTARNHGLNEIGRLKAAIVAISTVKERLLSDAAVRAKLHPGG